MHLRVLRVSVVNRVLEFFLSFPFHSSPALLLRRILLSCRANPVNPVILSRQILSILLSCPPSSGSSCQISRNFFGPAVFRSLGALAWQDGDSWTPLSDGICRH